MQYELNLPPPNVKSYLKGLEILLRYAANKNKKSNLPAVLIWLLLGTVSFLYFSSHEGAVFLSDILPVAVGFTAGSAVVWAISYFYTRSTLTAIYHSAGYFARPSRFYANAQGFRQVYPDNLTDTQCSWAIVETVETFNGDVILNLGTSMILLPDGSFTDETQRQQFIADARQWRESHGSLLQPDAMQV